MELDAEIAASTAELSVLKTFEKQTPASMVSDEMEFYTKKGIKPVCRKTATSSTQPSGPNIGAQVSLNAGEQSYSMLNML